MGKIKDLTGQKFGRWRVLSFSGLNRHRQSMWDCRCSCGTQREVAGFVLTSGDSKSCGCLKAKLTRDRLFVDLTAPEWEGKFGRLKVIKYYGKDKHGESLWICKCQCGETKIHPTRSSALISGKIRSCSCLQKEVAGATMKQNRHLGTISRTKYELTRQIQKKCGSIKKASEASGVSVGFLNDIVCGKKGAASKYYPLKSKVLESQTPDSIRRKRQHLCDFCQGKVVEVTNYRLNKRNTAPQDCPILCSPSCMEAWNRGEKRQLPNQGIMWDLPKPPKPRRRNKDKVAIEETVKMAKGETQK